MSPQMNAIKNAIMNGKMVLGIRIYQTLYQRTCN